MGNGKRLIGKIVIPGQRPDERGCDRDRSRPTTEHRTSSKQNSEPLQNAASGMPALRKSDGDSLIPPWAASRPSRRARSRRRPTTVIGLANAGVTAPAPIALHGCTVRDAFVPLSHLLRHRQHQKHSTAFGADVMAYTLIGGTIGGTVLTLLVLLPLYVMVVGIAQRYSVHASSSGVGSTPVNTLQDTRSTT